MDRKKIVIIDGNSLLFRAYYATSYGDASSIMRTKDGTPTNAIFAFANMLLKILRQFEGGESIFVGFDADGKTFRKEEFSEYKANRKPAPEDLCLQFPISREFLSALGIKCYEEHGIEADDICGTVAKKAAAQGMEVTVYTSDKDYLQLIEDHITVELIKSGMSNLETMTPASMVEKFGFQPKQIIDFKGLRGDSSDNLPGIPGVGDKTALKLILEYGSFDAIVEAAKKGEIKGKVGQAIVDNEDMGRACYRLATIITDAEMPFSIEDLEYEGYDFEKLSQFCAKYEFHQYLSRLPEKLKKSGGALSCPEIETVSSLKGLSLGDEIGLAIDLSTDAYHDEVPAGLALASKNKIYYLSADDARNDDSLKAILEDEGIKKNVYDRKMVEIGLLSLGLQIKGIGFDILLAGYLCDSSLASTPRAVFAFYGADVSASSAPTDLFAIGNPEYTGKIAFYSLALKQKALKGLADAQAEKLYWEIEFPLSEILARMESEGFPLDGKMLSEIGEEFRKKRDGLEMSIHALAGQKFNIASPKQVGEILYTKLGLPAPKNGSTSVETLKELIGYHPIVEAILEYRKYAKLVGTYIDGLLPHIKEDGKIHTCFNQAQTTTGRLSSSNPNLQNISTRDEEGKLIRKAFYYPDRNIKIMSLDYGQIELRILASLSKCQSYIDVFAAGRDVHEETARRIFQIPEGQEVPSILRRRAKAVNFAIIYGTTPFGLADQIECSPKEAAEIIRNFYIHYPEIGEYLSSIVKDVERDGYVTTMFGRRRYLRDINDPVYTKREAARRAALNAPVQGTAADLIKIAMIKVDEFLRKGGYKTKMVLQIHDELLFAVPQEEVEIVYPKIKEIMETCIDLPVKLDAEGSIGSSWYDAKD